jgi:hypothetical protein
MKTKVAFLTFLAAATVSCAWAQSTEDDDMYFTSKDRVAFSVAQNASRQAMLASTDARRITESEVAPTINPTDSYSARNVNPEYISGAKVGSNSTTVAQYFSPNYQPTSVNQNLASNCNSCGFNNYNGFNNGFGSNRFGNMMYGMGGMGMNPWGYNGFGMNPYSSFYDPYGMGMMGNNFYQPGLSFGLGSGFGNSFGFGNSWGSPSSMFWNNYYGMNSFGGGFGNPYSYYGSGGNYYGSRVVIVQDTRSTQARPTWGDANSSAYYQNRQASSTASHSNSSAYYDRSWKQSTTSSIPDRGSWGNTNNSGSNSGGRQSSWSNNNQSSWSNDGFRNSNSGNGFNSGGGGSRSSGFSGGGGGSSGGRRGRD